MFQVYKSKANIIMLFYLLDRFFPHIVFIFYLKMDLPDSTCNFSPCSVEESNSLDIEKRALKCIVCGDEVVHLHFGKAICDSCGVFFRRIVTKPQELICRKNESCRVEKSGFIIIFHAITNYIYKSYRPSQEKMLFL